MNRPRPTRAKPQPAQDFEALCRRCGRCCYAKLILDGHVVYTPYPCPHLDEHSRLCTVYDKRFEVNPQCVPAEEAIRNGLLPGDCPYVRELPGYVPPRERWTEQELALWAEQQEADRRRGQGGGRRS